MTSVLSLPSSELETRSLEGADAETSPVSGTRHKAAGSSLRGRDALDLYYADIARSRPLSRDGEIAIGRRIEAAERAILEAWVACPRALHELALTAVDTRTEVLRVEDLLAEPDARDATAEARITRLTELLDKVLAIASRSPDRRAQDPASAPADAALPNELEEVVSGLVELPLDPMLGERIEQAMKQGLVDGPEEERPGIQAALSAIARARRAIAAAKSELVEANLRLSIAIARQFRRAEVPLVDLAQEGNLGLMRAVDRFDYRRGYRFSTYAAWWIKQSIRYAILRKGRCIRMPAHLVQARNMIARARRELMEQLGRSPTTEEIAQRAELAIDVVRAVAELSLDPLSLDAPVGEDDAGASFGDFLAGSEPMPDETLGRRELAEHTRALVADLPQREREVLERRYGLYGREGETLEQIGRSWAVTRERIRQIEAQALEKLRTRSKKLALGDCL